LSVVSCQLLKFIRYLCFFRQTYYFLYIYILPAKNNVNIYIGIFRYLYHFNRNWINIPVMNVWDNVSLFYLHCLQLFNDSEDQLSKLYFQPTFAATIKRVNYGGWWLVNKLWLRNDDFCFFNHYFYFVFWHARIQMSKTIEK
jgi:hypothetical protein